MEQEEEIARINTKKQREPQSDSGELYNVKSRFDDSSQVEATRGAILQKTQAKAAKKSNKRRSKQ